MSADKRPVLGISMGDPGGIGPEITAKALNEKKIYLSAGPFEKFKLLLKKIVTNIIIWFKSKLNKNKG